MSENIIFIACGSFNPPTPMHFRMFEIARDYFHGVKQTNVLGGIVSPVHDEYKKLNLASAEHRCKMIKLSLLSSDWIQLSNWECQQNHWMPTLCVLQYHQNRLNSILNANNDCQSENDKNWMPSNITEFKGQTIRIKLLCGADLLESFLNNNVWHDNELESILDEHGVVVIARNGTNPQKFIFDSDLMHKYQNNITIIENWVPNEISSTLARVHIRRGLSVKYLLNDDVIDYIHQKKLYHTILKQRITTRLEDFHINKSHLYSEHIIHSKQQENEHIDMDVTDSYPGKLSKSRQNYRKVSSTRRKYDLRRKQQHKISGVTF